MSLGDFALLFLVLASIVLLWEKYSSAKERRKNEAIKQAFNQKIAMLEGLVDKMIALECEREKSFRDKNQDVERFKHCLELMLQNCNEIHNRDGIPWERRLGAQRVVRYLREHLLYGKQT